MAIERMEMMNMVGHLEDMDKILRDVVKISCLQPVREIQQAHVASTLAKMEIGDENEQDWIRFVTSRWEYREAQMRIDVLMERLGIPKKISNTNLETDYNFEDIDNNILVMFDRFASYLKEIEQLEKEKKALEKAQVISLLQGVEIDFKEIHALKHYTYRIGSISKEHRLKLSINYENISAAVMKIGAWKGQEIYLTLFPRALEQENERILRSIDFDRFEIPEAYLDTPAQAMVLINSRLNEVQVELDDLAFEMERFSHTFTEDIQDAYNKLKMEEALVELRGHVTVTRNFFFLSGWVPRRETTKLERYLKEYEERVIISFKEAEAVDPFFVRPTRLRNNWLVQPFEMLVKTYGTPAYHEMDPTFFTGITYMILFGAMFGDLGQGFAIFLAGLWLVHKKGIKEGGILSRVGLSSMAFGTFYGSLFGNEEWLRELGAALFGEAAAQRFFFHGMDRIDTVLVSSVVLGTVLLILCMSMGIYVKIKNKDYAEGYLGRYGVAGTALYMILLVLLVGIATGNAVLPTGVLVTLATLLVFVVGLREPIMALVSGHRPLIHESLGMFIVELFFETYETFMGYFSNTLSFIRVGAFALNHIGLFMAFHQLAEMMNSPFGNVSMFIIGNVLVIGLEGLIVLIQGMRLLYYELYSKYFTGDGREFKAISLNG